MNRTYRLKWNDGRHAWIPVGENARTRGSRAGARALRRLGAIGAVLLALPGAASALAPDALPTGFNVIQGSGSDGRSGNVYTVTQNGQRGVFGFDTFNVGSDAAVNVKQSAGAAALFLVRNDPSYIYGKFNADATVFLANPNGIFFGKGAAINVGGMLATTMSMDPDEFMKGRYRLTSPGKGQISNESVITAAGSVALVGNDVQNSGTIVATSVTLASGNAVAIELTGDGLIRARVEDPALKASILNSGTIKAVTAVTLTAGQARDTLDRVVNNTGVIRATGLTERGGEIVLEGGLVSNSGTLDASSATGAGGDVALSGRDVILASNSVIDVSGATWGGTAKVLGDMDFGTVFVDGHIYARGGSGDGGFVETSAARVDVADSFRIHALSVGGRAGKWLIDPLDFYITAGVHAPTSSGIGATTLVNALNEADVTIATDNANSAAGNYGDIYVNSAVSWGGNTVLTLAAYRNIYINAGITATGTSAGLKLFYGGSDATTAAADYTNYSIGSGASITLSGSASTLWVANHQYTLIHTEQQLAALGALVNPSGYYALGNDLNFGGYDYYGNGFQPIGTGYSNQFLGRFDGLGHKISNLTITGCYGASACSTSYSSFANVGLFGYVGTGAVIRDIGLENILVDTDSAGYHANNVGTLVGTNYGEIYGSWATGTINATKADGVGGLVGANMNSGMYGALIADSYTNVAVNGQSYVGGLAGTNGQYSYIKNSHATGNVTAAPSYAGAPNSNVGGLVGYNLGDIYDSYATGNVAGNGGAYYYVGGLAGYNEGTINNSYAIGNVSGHNFVGGLVGYNYKGAIYGSYYALGTVYADGDDVGGLVGWNGGTALNWGVIAGSHSYGTVHTGASDRNGGLVGYNAAHGRITDSYSGAWVVSGGSKVGGLVGGNAGEILRSFAEGDVTGVSYVGGLVGYNEGSSGESCGSIIDSYSTGSVETNGGVESGVAGGLVGRNEGRVIRTYAAPFMVSGLVSGGLIGENASNNGSPALVQDSFWVKDAASGGCHGLPPCATGIGNDPSSTGATGLSLDEFKKLSSFAGWDIDDMGGTGKAWRIYDGYTLPLLRALLTPLVVTADDISKTYDGSPYTGDLVNDTYSPSNAPSSEKVRNFSDPYDSPKEVGEYLPKLYSYQDGYDISYVGAKLKIVDPDAAIAIVPIDPIAILDGGTNHVSEEAKKMIEEASQTWKEKVLEPILKGEKPEAGLTLAKLIEGKGDKPTDEIAAPGRGKGRMLVCRKG